MTSQFPVKFGEIPKWAFVPSQARFVRAYIWFKGSYRQSTDWGLQIPVKQERCQLSDDEKGIVLGVAE